MPASGGTIDDDAMLGGQLRALRHARGLSLQELSAISGLSIGWISLVERGMTNPSLKSLRALAAGLGVSVAWLLNHGDTAVERERGLIVRQRNRRRMDLEGGLVKELLTPSLAGPLETLLVSLPPGGSSGDEAYTHAGDEAGFVIEGTLDLWVDAEHYRLLQGDSFGFASTRPHRFANPGDVTTRVIWVITPPVF